MELQASSATQRSWCGDGGLQAVQLIPPYTVVGGATDPQHAMIDHCVDKDEQQLTKHGADGIHCCVCVTESFGRCLTAKCFGSTKVR